MSPEERKLLEEAVRLGRENNELLRAARRGARWRSAWHALWWLVIIGASVASYYYLQPWIDRLLQMYTQISGSLPH